ncbi:hypothetical protein V7S43_018431 [Phytophthora oleae]|uniref:Cyst germination specific acidic repeat protein n=1 Tax=Phytophthora oleae TaxID=2107226 RepID=A0ABD3EQU0_9STRA
MTPRKPATVVTLTGILAAGLASADVPISVQYDATYSLSKSSGLSCSGDGKAPVGTICPKAGDIATADCYPYLPSFNGTNCVAPVDAHCVLVHDNAWGCSFLKTNGDAAVYQHSGATTDYETPSTSEEEKQHSGESYTVASGTEQPCGSTQAPAEESDYAPIETTAIPQCYSTETADTPTVEIVSSVETTTYLADEASAPYKTATPEPVYEVATTEPVYETVTTQPPYEPTEPVYDAETTEPVYKPVTTKPVYESATTKSPYATTEPAYQPVTTEPPYETTEPVYEPVTTEPPYATTEPVYDAETTEPVYKPVTTKPVYESATTKSPYATTEPAYQPVTTEPPYETTEPVYEPVTTEPPYATTEPVYESVTTKPPYERAYLRVTFG